MAKRLDYRKRTWQQVKVGMGATELDAMPCKRVKAKFKVRQYSFMRVWWQTTTAASK